MVALYAHDEDITDPRGVKRRSARRFGIQHRRHDRRRATHLMRPIAGDHLTGDQSVEQDAVPREMLLHRRFVELLCRSFP
jgi:hypothetical protein